FGVCLPPTNMYKNQLQELAQKSCFSFPAYTCIREGPDHAPRFKSRVDFNGEIFESPTFYATLKQAEHAAAKDESIGVYKNMVQDVLHRAGLNLPEYVTFKVQSEEKCMIAFACENQQKARNKLKRMQQSLHGPP
ncbi:hypothetical protein Tsubulata_009604, partial [Turnera subulata]